MSGLLTTPQVLLPQFSGAGAVVNSQDESSKLTVSHPGDGELVTRQLASLTMRRLVVVVKPTKFCPVASGGTLTVRESGEKV
jgi:hypothetical protein